ncbi:MAG: isopentenyl-diphosphate Delta-isomerase [Chitinophagaceae bacterium]|nr:MAG: isopentenyl-diphosphate Delta-isomerase [Chitinophagaceae bacterium]
MNPNEVILVTPADQAIGVMEKMEAHQKGVLHRAFSVFLFDRSGRMLLQQRAGQKYHGAYLWTNACCSHPMQGETVEAAAQRRLREELGFETPLEKIFAFQYKAMVENDLIEHEYDHVFAGAYEGPVQLNLEEVCSVAYEELAVIKQQLERAPERFTSWFRIAFPQIETWWKKQYAAGKQPVAAIGEQEKQ